MVVAAEKITMSRIKHGNSWSLSGRYLVLFEVYGKKCHLGSLIHKQGLDWLLLDRQYGPLLQTNAHLVQKNRDILSGGVHLSGVCR